MAEYDNIQTAMNKFGHKYALSARLANGWLTAMVVEAALKKEVECLMSNFREYLKGPYFGIL